MTAQATMPYRPAQHEGKDGFAQLVRAEWIKFRTVRGWVIGMVVAVLVMVGLGLFAADRRQQLVPECGRRAGPDRPGLRAHVPGRAGWRAGE